MEKRISLLIISLTLILLLSGCYGIIEGTVNQNANCSGGAAQYTRILVDDVPKGCTGNNGSYSYQVDDGGRKITYRKSGFKALVKTITVPTYPPKTDPGACLDPETKNLTIRGNITKNGSGIQDAIFELYRIQCGQPSLQGTIKTCFDGTYSFPELESGTYEVIPTPITGCTISPISITSIAIPLSDQNKSYNFKCE